MVWAEEHHLRWAFTLSNAGACYFEDRCDLAKLGEIDWNAVRAKYWQECRDGKQAEFLIERRFPLGLVSRIGVLSQQIRQQVVDAFAGTGRLAADVRVEVRREWYY